MPVSDVSDRFCIDREWFRASKWLKSIKFREKSLEFPRRVLFWSESEIKIRSRIIKSSGINWAQCVLEIVKFIQISDVTLILKKYTGVEIALEFIEDTTESFRSKSIVWMVNFPVDSATWIFSASCLALPTTAVTESLIAVTEKQTASLSRKIRKSGVSLQIWSYKSIDMP